MRRVSTSRRASGTRCGHPGAREERPHGIRCPIGRGAACDGGQRNLRNVVTASFIGTTIEWYDSFLYGTAAALVFNELFFPDAEPIIGTLAALGTYALGLITIPLAVALLAAADDKPTFVAIYMSVMA